MTIRPLLAAATAALALASSAALPQPARAATVPACGAMGKPIHQVASPTTGSSYFSASAAGARKAAQAHDLTDARGVTFVAATAPAKGLVAVRRLSKAASHDFLFTTSRSEVRSAVASYGYRDEGVAFYASPTPAVCAQPVMRVVRGAAHRLATTTELEALGRQGWRTEGGVKFFVGRVATAATPAAAARPAVPTPVTGAKPSAATTGVPKGTKLRRHVGNITVTRDGTVLDRLDIRGFVTIRARDVTIRRSVVRGGVVRHNTGLVTNYGYPGLLLEDVLLKPARPSVWIDGIKGSDFTARRVHVVGGVDSVKIHGDDVRIESSLLEDTQYFAHDPNQGGRGTHNDNVQILQGRDLVIRGNTIRGATGFGILAAANHGDVPNLRVSGNWLDGGWCSMKLEVLNGHALRAVTSGNRFGRNQGMKSCPFQAVPGTRLTSTGDVYEDDSSPVRIVRKR